MKLDEVAETGNIQNLYKLIQKDPFILERIDKVPFINTPLHKAAAAGNTQFTLEMMRLKPSFARKLNPDGFTPIHLAVECNHDDLVICMINVDRELVRVQGTESNSPLHCAAEKGNVDLVVQFLLACPESILDVNVRKESALHIAVLHNQIDTVKVMLEWLKLLDAEFILGWTDHERNSILHIAASKNYVQMVRMLIPKLDIYSKNLHGDSALEIIQQAQTPDMLQIYKKLKIMHWLVRKKSHYNATLYCDTNNNSSLTRSLKNGFPWYKRWILSNHRHISLVDRNGVLVVAVLIATTAYQAVVALPTIFRPIIDYASHYYLFIFQIFNTAGFVAAMSLIFILLPPGIFYVLTLIVPIMVCYFVGLYLSNLETGLFMFSLFMFLWQLVRFGRMDRNGRRERHFLLKHSASFSKELERKGYKYETAI